MLLGLRSRFEVRFISFLSFGSISWDDYHDHDYVELKVKSGTGIVYIYIRSGGLEGVMRHYVHEYWVVLRALYCANEM